MSTKVFIADVSVFEDDALFDYFYKMMPADRKKKIDEKKFAKDKFLSLGVGALLRVAPCEKHFNLSHSGTMAMCIISDGECGCDIELKREGTLGIADRFFYGEEKDLIASQDSEEKKTDMFFRLWTLKESFMKATRLGFKLALDEFSVVPDGDKIILSQRVNDSAYRFFEYDVKGYGCSICLKDYEGEKPEIELIDLRKILWQKRQ